MRGDGGSLIEGVKSREWAAVGELQRLCRVGDIARGQEIAQRIERLRRKRLQETQRRNEHLGIRRVRRFGSGWQASTRALAVVRLRAFRNSNARFGTHLSCSIEDE